MDLGIIKTIRFSLFKKEVQFLNKIGILTFHKSINYGSVLQAWAIQTLLIEKGYDVSVIDYQPSVYKEMYDIMRFDTPKEFIKSILSKLPIAYYLKKQKKTFENFRNRKMHLSSYSLTIESDYNVLQNKYDCIVCGSDQIWNIRAKDCDPIFFLPIAHEKVKKITYAVSINDTDFTEKVANEKLKGLIRDFDYISVREESGRKKLQDFINYKNAVFCDLDPTLLHDKKIYNLITSPRIIGEKYIFLYNVWPNDEVFEAAKKISHILKLPVYTAFMARGVRVLIKVLKKGVKVICNNTSPEDFLSLIKYAEYVVTDSFHGTAFSIVFEKKFVCINVACKNDERICNVLKILDLEERYISKENIELFDYTGKINYTIVTQKRLEAANESINRLLTAINS